MNYKKHYELLIARAKARKVIDAYTEKHHIIPRCLGGNNKRSNLVELYPEEHYTAHLLLVKMNPDNRKLVKAASMMCSGSNLVKRSNNKLYGWLRRRLAIAQSECQSGTGNSQFGTKWIHSKELRISKKIPVSQNIPDNWELGRILNWDKVLAPITYNNCPTCGKLKNSLNKFCSHSCSATHGNNNRETIFDKYLTNMLEDYKNGMSIHKCLTSRNLCGTGINHIRLSTEIKNRGIV